MIPALFDEDPCIKLLTQVQIIVGPVRLSRSGTSTLPVRYRRPTSFSTFYI